MTMISLHFGWKKLGITQKFSAIFTLLLALLLLMACIGYLSLFYIRRAEEKIQKSRDIFQYVMKMDNGMERAYRLHGDYFLHFQHLGLQKAHELYAQPSVREIAQVIHLSNEMSRQLFVSKEIDIPAIQQADINLYIASAKRFATTSIESFELLSERSAPERGLEAQITAILGSLADQLKGSAVFQEKYALGYSFYKDYLIQRQRFLMQSSLNETSSLMATVRQDSVLPSTRKETIFTLIDAYQHLADKLLAVDLALNGKLHDFYLQSQAIAPISNTLVKLTQEEVAVAEQRIETFHAIYNKIIPIITLTAILMLVYIARLIHHSITRNVINLTEAATAFSEGNLDSRVAEESSDELGRLAAIFNNMAARLKDLIDNLEIKVARRTEELARSEERFRQLVRELPNIAVQGYGKDHRILYWNKASENLFGYSSVEAAGKKLEDLIIPEQMRAGFCELLRNWHDDDVPIPASELLLRDKTGKEVPVYAAHVMQVDSSGEKTMYSVDVDLAELKLSQAREQRSESFYRQLFDHSSSGVIVYEPVDNGRDFIIRDFNRAGEEIEQISRTELIGKTVTEVFPGLISMGLMDTLRRVLKTGEPMLHPVSYYRDDRTEGWRENRVYKLPSGEIVAVYDDVTKQRRAEEEKQAMAHSLQRAQKMEAIGLMAGGIAHDLNNTLSAIVGYPELLLLQLPEDSTLRRPLTTIKDAGERAAAVIADLLTVARGAASTRQTANLNALVREYLNSPEFSDILTQYPQIRFNHTLAENLPNISCSPIHVKKCIMNLIANGAESIPQSGSVILTTFTELPDRELADRLDLKMALYSVLRVKDSGTCIPETDMSHIFEPFYTKRAMGKRGGTGLGLSVVWNTMKDHAGAVVAASCSEGTQFDLYFPVSAEAVDVLLEQQTEDPRGAGETILVIDDELHQCHLARKILEYYGYRVAYGNSGEKAVEYLTSHQTDLLVLDMIMAPGMNGRQTYAEILKIHPGQKAIIASGFSESDDVKATLRMGAATFIKKPYSMKELALAVKNALRGRRITAEESADAGMP